MMERKQFIVLKPSHVPRHGLVGQLETHPLPWLHMSTMGVCMYVAEEPRYLSGGKLWMMLVVAVRYSEFLFQFFTARGRRISCAQTSIIWFDNLNVDVSLGIDLNVDFSLGIFVESFKLM